MEKNNRINRGVQVLGEYGVSLCIAFSISVFLYAVIARCMGEYVISATTVVSLALACALGTLVQLVCFSTYVWPHMRYTWRLLLFGFLFLPVLVICAIVFSWFPMQSGAAWIGFLTAYAGMLVLTTGAFELYYYFAGKKYDGILGQYRTKMKQRDEPDVPQGNDPV